jgi:4-amino-4-deoxy-L-arabinose transferase-like glycosyltransferase
MISGKIPINGGGEMPQSTKISIGHLKGKFFAGWYTPSLTLILFLAVCLDFWQLGQHGYSNLYYAAGVRSMLINPHNFFFAAYDPNGFITVDKPPVDFWLQVLSAKLLGFSPFSLLLPQALAGVLSVALIAHLIRRSFGKLAGLMAALALTLTPISVITSRNNDVDSMLVLVTLLAAWAILIAVERGSLPWLLVSMGLVGLGFNVKMAEAYLIVPAFVLLYLFTSPRNWRTKIWHLIVAGIVLLVVSLSWSVAVDLTPPAQRPFVGSSKANSELHLAFGYNGIHRLLSFPPPPRQMGTRKIPLQPSFPGKAVAPPQSPFSGGQEGLPGPMRLFNNQLAGQISWLLPLALIGVIVFLWRLKDYKRQNKSFQGIALWCMWFLTVGTFFSASTFQIYYMVMLAPAICALVGIGFAALWHEYTNMSIRGLILPLALLITATAQLHFLSPFPAWMNSQLPPTIVVVVSTVALFLFILYALKRVSSAQIPALLTTVGMLVLLLAPMLWTVLPILAHYNTSFPVAGPYGNTTPTLARTQMLMTEAPQNATLTHGNLSPTDLRLLDFLATHEGRSSYLYATTTTNYSESAIIETGKGVMTMGGYAGTDQILTRAQLIDLVHRGIVRYFLLPGTIPSFLRELTSWITSTCQRVPYSAWYPNKFFPQGTHIAGLRLYEYTGVSPLRLKPHHRHSIHIRHFPLTGVAT